MSCKVCVFAIPQREPALKSFFNGIVQAGKFRVVKSVEPVFDLLSLIFLQIFFNL